MPHSLLVTALMPEATPLINHYNLKPDSGSAIRTYSNGPITLCVSGMGALNAAIATAASLAAMPSNSVALNVGIVGADQDIGKLFRASKLTSRRFSAYPGVAVKSSIPVIAVETVDSPCANYKRDRAYDMEAIGFWQAAIKFSPSELVQCLKIISDNPSQPVMAVPTDSPTTRQSGAIKQSSKRDTLQTITATTIQTLISDCLPAIDDFHASMLQLANQLPQSDQVEGLVESISTKIRFSVTQKISLTAKLRRIKVLLHQIPEEQTLLRHKDSSSLLQSLDALLKQQAPNY